MKKYILDFLRRGVMACGLGPAVLAVLYLILYRNGAVETLSVEQVCTGVVSLTVLAFIAGSLNALYQIERLPLMLAVLIHGSVLYAGYLVTYLINDWLEWSLIPVLVFTGIFIVGYLVIWAIICAVIRKRTARLNKLLRTNHPEADI